jgi:hypothetical protein
VPATALGRSLESPMAPTARMGDTPPIRPLSNPGRIQMLAIVSSIPSYRRDAMNPPPFFSLLTRRVHARLSPQRAKKGRNPSREGLACPTCVRDCALAIHLYHECSTPIKGVLDHPSALVAPNYHSTGPSRDHRGEEKGAEEGRKSEERGTRAVYARGHWSQTRLELCHRLLPTTRHCNNSSRPCHNAAPPPSLHIHLR